MNRQSSSESTRGRRKARGEQTAPVSPLLRILRGTGIALCVSCLTAVTLLAVTAGIVYSRPDPDSFLIPTSLLVLVAASLLCGVVAERVSGAKPLPVGAIAGTVWVILTFLASLALGGGAGALPSVYAMALRIPQLLLVLLGAFLAKRRPRRASPRRRR